MSHDFARAPYIPSLATHKKVVRVMGFDGDFEYPLIEPTNANPANCVPIPAENTHDVQTFFFGAMSHSLTIRPYRPDGGCCASAAYKFDLATSAFGPVIGNGEISNGCCSNEVHVNLPNTVIRGEISNACCTLQPRINLDWQTGENVSYRHLPACTICGPWRTGFVGTAPGEEEQYQIRYWSAGGSFITCNLFLCCYPCKMSLWTCKQCCVCPDELGYTTWHPLQIANLRAKLLSEFALVLDSSFGEPVFDNDTPFTAVGIRSTAHKSDVNALGNMRIRQRKSGCCCNWVMMDPSDTTDTSSQTGLDLTFRGTFNQNVLDPKDFNIALGYLILNTKFFLDSIKRGTLPSMAATQTLPRAFGLLHLGDVRPNAAGIGGNKMV
jgi:hypothetical protein